MTCEDCIHYGICLFHLTNDEYKKCCHFKTTEEVVEVTRCKDCKYCEERHYEEKDENPYVKLICKWSNYSHQPDDFCSYGERKSE